MVGDRARLGVLALAWAGFVLAAYCPDVGRGFVKDDFTWIRSARAALARPSTFLVPTQPGFYRPVVSASFALDYALNDWRPRGYGRTNVALYGACTVAVGGLALALGLTVWASALAAFVWAVNPHGIGMAVVWLSGRTALCLTFCSVLAAIACVRRRYVWMAVAIALALLSKEEAIALPFILLVWASFFDPRRRPPSAAVVAAFGPLAAYFVVRSLTPAFTPASAPEFYRFTVSPALVARNFAEYADRSATLAAAAVLLAAAVCGRWPGRDAALDRIAALSLTWWAGMFAMTMWLPIRSSLYAVCPSAGAAIAAAALVERIQAGTTVRRRWILEGAIAVAILAAVPAYHVRDAPWVEGARVSQRTLTTIRTSSADLPATGTIVFHDDADPVSSFHNAFGDLATEALQTAFDRPWRGRIVAAGDAVPPDTIAQLRLVRGDVVVIATAGTPR